MPIYEFQCRQCRRKTTTLVLVRDRIDEVRCQHCGSADLVKLYSRFATVKSEEARLEALADPSSLGDLDENDPASVARWMKRWGRELGEDFGDELDEELEKELSGKNKEEEGEASEEETSDADLS
jgi:putative FmdB family regulatory protein